MPDSYPALLRRALDLLAQTAGPALRARAEMLIKIGIAIVAALRATQPAGGRAVVATIFALQARLQPAPAQIPAPFPPEALEAISPVLALIESAAADPAQRVLLIRWLDVFTDRLTMPRYGDPRKRRHQARALLADSLRILTHSPAGMPAAHLPSASDGPLDAFCDCALMFWDIFHAKAQAEYGWNRIEAPNPESMGGYFALGETPHPPAEPEIRAAAQRLLQQLSQTLVPAQPAGLAPWLTALHAEMAAPLAQFTQFNNWPAWTRANEPVAPVSLIDRLKAKLRRNPA